MNRHSYFATQPMLEVDISPRFDVASMLRAKSGGTVVTTSSVLGPKAPEVIEDPYCEFSNDDAVILLLGPSGSGKSTFINRYLREQVASVKSELGACTQRVTAYRTEITYSLTRSTKKHVVLIDTPGFFGGRDSHDFDTFAQICSWLCPEDGRPKNLAGIIYVHDVSQRRIVNEMKLPFQLVEKMCGKEACLSTILLTYQWPDSVDSRKGARRRMNELHNTLFKPMMEEGATAIALTDGKREADVVKQLLENEARPQGLTLDIQNELLERRTLGQTAAGTELRTCLSQLLAMFGDPQSEEWINISNSLEQLNACSKTGKRYFAIDRTRYTEQDALILVMGPSGSGKSTFINQFTGRRAARVTHDMSACTQQVRAYKAHIPLHFAPSTKTQVVLVDTPGFFGGPESDNLATINQIVNWLRPKVGPERQLTGVIYLHDMNQKRIARETKMSLSLFREICGADSCSKTVVVKTHWPSGSDPEVLERAQQLEDDFFKDMKEAGARIMNVKGGQNETESDVVQYLLANATAQDIILQLQQELEDGKTLPLTAAGKELKRCLLQLLMYTDPGTQKEHIADLRKAIDALTIHPSFKNRLSSWLKSK